MNKFRLVRWTFNLEAPSSIPALTASWTYSRQFRVQLLERAYFINCQLACLRQLGVSTLRATMKSTGLPVIVLCYPFKDSFLNPGS